MSAGCHIKDKLIRYARLQVCKSTKKKLLYMPCNYVVLANKRDLTMAKQGRIKNAVEEYHTQPFPMPRKRVPNMSDSD